MKTVLIALTVLLAPLVTTLTLAAEPPLLTQAREVAMQMPPKLFGALTAEMGKSGAEGAIPVCRDMAPDIAGQISKQTGWTIKRVSLKPRNAARATPDAWEKAALEDFDTRAAAGESPATLEKGEQVGGQYRYVKAMPVQPLCLACHGSAEQISPAVKAVLVQSYPKDQATGYEVGQIRGAISLSKPLQ